MSRSSIALLALLALGQAAAVFAQDSGHSWHQDDVFRTFFDEYNATMYNMMHMHDHPHRHGKGNGNGNGYGFFDPLGLTNSTGRRLNQAPGLNSTRMQDLRTYIEDAMTNLKDSLSHDKHAILDAMKSGADGMKKWTDQMMVDLNNTNLRPGAFLSDILGANASNYLPTSWDNMTNWSQLMGFDFQGSLTDFVNSVSLQNLTRTQSLAELYAELENVISAFCTGPTPVNGTKEPAACTGPSVTLQLVPKTCVLDDISKTLTCSPAILELIKTPATCNHKYYKPYSYTGKQCAITGTIGISKTLTIGGESFDIVLSDHNNPSHPPKPEAAPAPPTPAPVTAPVNATAPGK